MHTNGINRRLAPIDTDFITKDPETMNYLKVTGLDRVLVGNIAQSSLEYKRLLIRENSRPFVVKEPF